MTETTFMPLTFLRPLWLLGILVVLLLSAWRYRRVIKSKKQRLIASHLSANLVDAPATSSTQRVTFPLLAIIACIALSGPSFRSINMPLYQVEKAQVLVLDLSYSLYATDLKPNRLSQEKYKAIDLIKQWNEGDKGLIAYAGDAFTIAPLTADGNAIISHIPNLSPDIMPVTGSRADLALSRAITLMKNAGYTQGHIVFFSDGIDKPTADKMIAQLKGTPWVVSILAIGTAQGSPIKMPDGSLLKNQQRQIVVPKLVSQPLQALTKATGGLYLKVGNTNSDIKQLSNYFNLKQAHKANHEKFNKSKFAKDDGYWLTFALLPLLLLLFRKGVFYVFLFSLSLPFFSPHVDASVWKNDQQNALQAYQEKDYATAAQLYQDPMAKGSALYKNKQYKEAATQFSQATTNSPTNATVFYNLGNTYAQLQQYEKAIEAYTKALAISPNFKLAEENRQLIEKLKKQQDKKNKQQKSEQQKSEQQKSEQQKSEQQKSEQQKSEQQKSEQQKSEQQKSEQQKSEQQKSEQQKSEQQKSEQQKSEQQKSEQQKSEQQKPEQQKSEQQKSEQQKSEQQKSEQQKSEQQKSEQQKSEQQKEKQDKQAKGHANETTDKPNKELENLPMWLKNMPDDPSLLLRNKMRLEYKKRAQSQSVEQQSNGDIW